MEDIDLDTGELLGTRCSRIGADGEPIDDPMAAATPLVGRAPFVVKQWRSLRIGVVVALTSLLDLDDTPAELSDRSASIPAEELRQLISETLGADTTGRDEVLFTRLLTDPGGRLLEVTELGGPRRGGLPRRS